MNKFYNNIFVVLVYKNTSVLNKFFETLNVPNSKVIVVNSYYDELSLHECKQIAIDNDADFIATFNGGYGHGNNVGCKYAIEHYQFNYLVISNSDIEILCLDGLDSYCDEVAVYAPYTVLPTGKRQNPNVVSCNYLYYKCYKWGYKNNNKLLLLFARINSRLLREITLLVVKFFKIKRMRVFAPHGSFIILTFPAVRKMYPLFNEDMFLYNEELFLGFICKKNNVPVYFVPDLKVLHLEGASSSGNNDSALRYFRESFQVLDKWKDMNSNNSNKNH